MRKKIVIFDNNSILIMALNEYLSNKYEVIVEEDLTKILDICNDYKPDIVIAELYVNDKFTVDYINKVKELYKDIKFVIYTRFNQSVIIEDLKNIDCIILKNALLDEIGQKLEDLFNSLCAIFL